MASGHQVEALSAVTTKMLNSIRQSGIDGMEVRILAVVTQNSNSSLNMLGNNASQTLILKGKYESALVDLGESGNQLQKSSKKLRGDLNSTMLRGLTSYSMGRQGFKQALNLSAAAISRSLDDLASDKSELIFLMEKLDTLSDMTITSETWRDAVSTWVALFKLINQLQVERGLFVLECMKADAAVLKALAAGLALIDINGPLPNYALTKLSNGLGKHIGDNSYMYSRKLSSELDTINRIENYKSRGVALGGAAITSGLSGVTTVVANFAEKAISAGGNKHWIMMAALAGTVVILCLCMCGLVVCVRKMYLAKILEKKWNKQA